MHIQVLVHVLLSWAAVQCLANPLVLMLPEHGKTLVDDIEIRDVSSDMSSKVNHLMLHAARDASALPQSDTVVVPLPNSTSDDSSPTSTPSVEEIESEVTPPFRRAFSSVASNAGKPAVQHVVQDLTKRDVDEPEVDPEWWCGCFGCCPGQESSTTATPLEERELSVPESGSVDPKCGGWYECIKKRALVALEPGLDPKCGGWYECIKKRTLNIFQPRLDPKCGGWYECIKKRSLKALQPGLDPKCGGWYECIKKRTFGTLQPRLDPKCGGWYECIKKRALDTFTTDLDPECGGMGAECIKKRSLDTFAPGLDPKCGGWYECIKKRALEVIHLTPRCGGGYECIGRRVVDGLPTIKGGKLST